MLFTYQNVEPFLLEGLKIRLAKSEEFDPVREQTEIIIRDRAGIAIPDVLPDPIAPDWIPRIAAAIVNKLAFLRMSSQSSEIMQRVDNDYKDALAFLDGQTARSDAASPTSFFAKGSVETGGLTW